MAANRFISTAMKWRVALSALPIVAAIAVAAPAASAAEVLQCHAVREIVGDRHPLVRPTVHLVTVDNFRDILLFDRTVLGVNIIDKAVISGWAEAMGAHGIERIALNIDRVTGGFDYSVVTESKPQFSRRLEGHCAPTDFETRF